MAADARRGYALTVFLEPVQRPEAAATAAGLRDLDAAGHRKSPLNPTDFKSGEYGRAATLEYTIAEYGGQRLNQKHFNAYLVHAGFWAHVHLSKIFYEPGDEKVFYEIVDSVGFVPLDSPAPAPPSEKMLSHMGEGSARFLRGDYRGAVGPYRKALDLERRTPQLPLNLWRVLVDNLTISYGLSGDLKRAKETAEYGLSKDPEYPLFHYLLSNTYAEMGDLDNAILYLRQAFARRRNVIPGETMPDPRADDSFKRYMKNERFLAVLRELNL